jgi:hypothetical protein
VNRAGPLFFLVKSRVMAQMDCYPTQAIMDSIVDVPRYPAPPNIQA